MNKHFLTLSTILIGIATLTGPRVHGADLSYKQWRAAMKAAEEARLKRDFEKVREILEASAPSAQKHGPLSSAENAWFLSWAYARVGRSPQALETINSELQRIDPKAVATKLQVIRGFLLAERSDLYFRRGDYENAMSSALESKTVLENTAGKFHPGLFVVHMTIGRIHTLRKNYAEAEEAMQMALRLAQSHGTAHVNAWSGAEEQSILYLIDASPDRVIFAATDLGHVLQLQGKFDEAEKAYKTAAKHAQGNYNKESVMHLLPLDGLAQVHLKTGRRKEFEKDVERVYEITSKTQGFEMWRINPLWLKLQLELTENNGAAAAETGLKIAKVCDIQNFDASSMAQRAVSLAVKDEQVDWKQAAAVENVLVKIAETHYSADAKKAGLILAELANFAVNHGKTDLAEAAYERVVKSQRNAKDKGTLIAALGKIAEAKIAQNKKTDALPVYHEITAAMREKYGNDTRVADAMDTEAGLLRELGQEQAAKDLQAQAQEVRKKAFAK